MSMPVSVVVPVLVLVPVLVPVLVLVLVLDRLPQPHCRAADIIGMLDYEKLDVYRCAIEHLSCVFKWLPLLPRGHSRVDRSVAPILDDVRLLNAVPTSTSFAASSSSSGWSRC